MDNTGAVINRLSYDSFGNVTAETNAGTSFRFTYTGREFDAETGQYYYRARYYDAETGSFISTDPVGFNAGDSNLYRYVANSPLNYTDSSGNYLESGWDLLSLGIGTVSLAQNLYRGDWKNAAFDAVGIVADGAALLLPIPGGVGAARNAGKVGKVAAWVNRSKFVQRGSKLVSTSRLARNTLRGAELANLGVNLYQTGESANDTYQKWLASCNGDIPWGDAVQTVLSAAGASGSANSLRKLNQLDGIKNATKGARNANLANQANQGKDFADAQFAIRRSNTSDNNIFIYGIDDLGNEILNDPVAYNAYQRLNKQGTNVIIDHGTPPTSNIAGVYEPTKNTVTIFDQNNLNAKDATSTLVHESVHVDSRARNLSYSQHEEYRAFRREFLYRQGRRPTLQERKAIWEQVQIDYSDISVGKNPFGGK